jgi:hypothetical protein
MLAAMKNCSGQRKHMTLVHKADGGGFRKFGCPKYLASIIE